MQVKDDSSSLGDDFSKKHPAAQTRTQQVLDYFSAREAKLTDIINSPSPIVDPSL